MEITTTFIQGPRKALLHPLCSHFTIIFRNSSNNLLCRAKCLAPQRLLMVCIISQLHLFNYRIFRNVGFMISMINSNMNAKHKSKKLTALSLKNCRLYQTIKFSFFCLSD